MSWRAAAEWIGFQGVWLACALGAAAGLNWPGVVAAGCFISLVTVLGRRHPPDLIGILASGCVGAIVETAFSLVGVVAYAAAPVYGGWLAPAWIIALWFAFGATLGAFEGLVGSRTWIWPAALGFVGGPLSYLAGARLGALQFPQGAVAAMLPIAIAWTAALPLLLQLRRTLNR